MFRSKHIKQWLLLTFPVIFSSCVNDPAKVKSFTVNNNLPIQTVHDIDLFYSDSACIKIHLTAPEVNEYAGVKPWTEMSKGVKVDFYTDTGTVDSWLTAEYAIRREKEQMMEAKKNVVVVNSAGDRLNTEHLIWDGVKRQIRTNSPVQITTKDQILFGNGMESDELFNNYRILEPTGSIDLPGDGADSTPQK